MPRIVFGLAAALALLGTSAAPAQPRLEVDVLELDESPEHAIQRMETARRRAADERSWRREAPDIEPFIPEDSLGSRGLEGVLEPATALPSADLADHLPGSFDLGGVLAGNSKGDDERHDDKDGDKGHGQDGRKDDDKKKGGD